MSLTKLAIGLLGALFFVTTANAKCGSSAMVNKAKKVVSEETNTTVDKTKTTLKAKDMVKGKCGVGKCG